MHFSCFVFGGNFDLTTLMCVCNIVDGAKRDIIIV